MSTFTNNLEAAQEYASQYIERADAYSQQLAAAISEPFYDSITAGLEWDIDPDTIQRPTEYGVADIADMVIPAFDDSALRDWDPVDYLLRTNYDSEFLEDLEQGCRSVFAGTIPGFTNASATALFGYRTERDTRDLALAMEQATVQFSARRGFPIPPDALAYKQNELLRRYADVQTDFNREVTSTLAERLTDCFKHAQSIGVQIETLRADVITKMSGMYLDKIKAQVMIYDTNMRAIIAAFEGKIAEARMRVENNQANVRNFQTWQSLVERNWATEKELMLDSTKTRMNQATQEIQSRVLAMEKVMEYYKGIAMSAGATAQSLDMRTEEATA